MNPQRCEARSARVLIFWIIGISFIPVLCNAHDQPVHMAIAQSAANSSTSWKQFLTENSESENTALTYNGVSQTAIKWIIQGAHDEDDTPRFADHFYTVTPNRVIGQALGLTDWHESIFLPAYIANSYAWGTVPGLTPPFLLGYPHPTENTETWEYSRSYEYAALTSAHQSDRDANMAHMFYALGHLLHLNQDLSQPDHVRNDEHWHPWHRWIENFGSSVYLHEPGGFPLEPHGWAWWQSQGFSKLLDFWDTGQYMGNPSALDADAHGNGKLGLAEFSNGNFLGEDAVYAEFFSSGNIHYFPFPSLANTTQPQLNPNNLSGTVIDTTTLENGMQGKRVYISKTSAGINIIHHSTLDYFAVLHPPRINTAGMEVSLTINDSKVLQEYHSILIPKAIEYSTGILDYFFRGTLSIECGDSPPGQIGITIINTSGQDFSGGQFHLFWDNANGDRSEITSPNFSTTYSGTLANGTSIDATFVPANDAVDYIIVYQGTIGVTSGSASDPVDSGIAIATSEKLSGPDWSQLEWGVPYYNSPQGGTFSPASAPSASATLTATAFSNQYGEQDGIVDNVGTLTYNGGFCVSKFHLDATGTPNDGVEVFITSALNGTLFYGFYFGNQDFDQGFCIPDTGGQSDTISVTFYGDTEIENDGYPNQISATLTLSKP